MERAYDLVLFGATGFTGGLTAEYLIANAPADARIALAGRNLDKLRALGHDVALIKADASDPDSLRQLAESTRVLVTTVGPYLQYGEPLVAACAAAGTGYLDLTGEPEFVDRMYLRYHAQATETGARLIHACGFDSVPHDLGAFYTVQQLPEGVPLSVNGYVRVGATFSGGTYHSAVTAMSRLRQMAGTARQRNKLEQGRWNANGRRVHGSVKPPHKVPEAGGWVLSAPLIDPQIVLRSARALERYGPDFSYGHYIVPGTALTTAQIIGAATALVLAAQTPPTRKLALGLRDPGDGPSEETRAKSWFRVRFSGEGGGKRVLTQVSGGDPGYGETAKMLAEAALCLAFDDVPDVAGQVTTAQALGQPLLERLTRAGISFETLRT
ncbi:MAG: saccharopine dehydrogenase NADP-binding domain-containing protein [Solirubrobacterales bacterium]|nr:saccharopine dehydrogenase NADP-binding domain-containing protein [Solirubrobacterales bacterium]